MDQRMEINVLDYRLKVMSLQKHSISQFSHVLIDIIFLKHHVNCNHLRQHGFVSVTETNEDFSLVVEEYALKLFDLDHPALSIVDCIWLPLVVSVGPDGTSATGISKIAKSVINPLADNGISVYCLSTYKTDYVLIKETDLMAACEVLAYDFRITREESMDSLEIIVSPDRIRQRLPTHMTVMRPITHAFTCPDNKFYVTSMDSESVPMHALTFIDLMFYSHCRSPPPKGHDRFFCLSIVDQDMSLVLDSETLESFPPNVLFNTSECWRMVKIGDMPEGLGFDECGVVAQISEPLIEKQIEISELYFSSYYRDHLLVPEEHIENVHKLLENRKAQSNSAATCNSQG